MREKIIFLIAIFIMFARADITKAHVMNINNIDGDAEYSRESDVPKSIYYKDGQYEGTLQLKETFTSSGEAPVNINYISDRIDFEVRDYCIWSKDDYTMYFEHQEGWLPWEKYVTVDGHEFKVEFSTTKKGVYFTKYATPDQPRGTDDYSDDPWTGPENCSDGKRYHTAIHYYYGYYTGNYTKDDTRKYKGRYEGTLYEIPEVVSNKVQIEDSYKINEVNWVKANSNFGIKIGGYTSFTSSAFKINSLHPLIKHKYGSTYINAYIKNGETSSTNGGVSLNENPYLTLSGISTKRNNNSAQSKFSMKINKDSEAIDVYPLLRVYRDGKYEDDSQIVANTPWLEDGKQAKVIADGVAPDTKIIGVNNIDWYPEDKEIRISSIDYGSGLKDIELWENGLLITKRNSDFSYIERKSGINVMKTIATDNVGNKREGTFYIKLDKIAPTIEGIPSEQWTRDDVQIQLYAADKESGIKSFSLYKIDNDGDEILVEGGGGEEILYYLEKNEGINRFKVVAEDNVGHKTEQTFAVKIDRTAPTISGIPSPNWNRNDVAVNLKSTDMGSGVRSIELYKLGLRVATGVDSLSYVEKTDGIHSFKVVTVDNVGNSKEQDFTVKVDKTAPEISGIPNISISKEETKFNLLAIDKLSGMKSLKLYRAGTLVVSGINAIEYTEKNLGEYEYKVIAEDVAGNVKEITFNFAFLRADLTITDMKIYDGDKLVNDIVQGQEYIIETRIKNIGKNSSAACNINVKNLSSNRDIANLPVQDIAPNQEITVRTKFIDATLGKRQLEGFVDSGNTEKEMREDNNKYILDYSVYPFNNKPIADFDVAPNPQDVYEDLIYADRSYDPDQWDKIIEKEWSYKLDSDSEWINTGGNPIPKITKYGKYNIRLRVRDQGNVASPSKWSDYCIRDINIVPFLTVQGTINPNPAPGGKKLHVNVQTTGKAKRIKVKFPDELIKLSTLEDPLVMEKEIKIEPNHTEELIMWLPLNSPKTIDKDGKRIFPAYKVYVEAENQYGIIVHAYIDLDVQGTILDTIQYSFRATGDDRKGK